MPGEPPEVPGDDAIQSLRDALAHSPDNVPLRQHLADTLLSRGHGAEAEKEFRAALALAPDNKGIQLGLARAFHQQGKNSHALALVETIVKTSNATGRAFLLHARLLVGIGEIEQAVIQYRRAVEKYSACADPTFAARLGINARPEESEVVEGRVRAEASADAEAGVSAEIERPKIAFKDVGGMEALKEEIRLKIIHPLAHPELYAAYGKAMGGGILMYGPPGLRQDASGSRHRGRDSRRLHRGWDQ